MTYTPPLLLRNGLAMTLYIALWANRNWEVTISEPEPPYQEHRFTGADEVPLFGIMAVPKHPKGTIIGTYGITGTLENQWYLRLLGRKAYAQGYAVVLFDWRAHGKTAELSPALTSDGLYEGKDFVHIAAQAKAMGCPAPFWFTGYSLGGQLALWAVNAAETVEDWGPELAIHESELAGGAVICPSVESNRSLSYLVQAPLGRFLEGAIAKSLKQLAGQIHEAHPGAIDPAAIERANSIWGFDHELVIGSLGFKSVEDYYAATSPLYLLPKLRKPILIIYAADDPMFDPTLVPDLQTICAENAAAELMLTDHGGHVGYLNSKAGQRSSGDCDRWWAWNRAMEWLEDHSNTTKTLC
ncbi:MAG: YheT family hydrolase [Thermosynechococcaceae cyanobacterium]